MFSCMGLWQSDSWPVRRDPSSADLTAAAAAAAAEAGVPMPAPLSGSPAAQPGPAIRGRGSRQRNSGELRSQARGAPREARLRGAAHVCEHVACRLPAADWYKAAKQQRAGGRADWLPGVSQGSDLD